METKIINIAKDFSEYPGPRYIQQGEYSGEAFYVNVLNPTFADCISRKIKLLLNLDSTAGYATSFLDEALGELVFDFSEKVVRDYLVIRSDEEPEWITYMESETFPQWERRRQNGQNPRSSSSHEIMYFDLTDNKVKKRLR